MIGSDPRPAEVVREVQTVVFMSNVVVLSLAAFALVTVACAAPALKSSSSATEQTEGTSETTGGDSTTASSTADGGVDTDASAAAQAAADQCYVTCISADAKAKAVDDAWIACAGACDKTNTACVTACNNTSDAVCAQSAYKTSCETLGACATKCYGKP